VLRGLGAFPRTLRLAAPGTRGPGLAVPCCRADRPLPATARTAGKTARTPAAGVPGGTGGAMLETPP